MKSISEAWWHARKNGYYIFAPYKSVPKKNQQSDIRLWLLYWSGILLNLQGCVILAAAVTLPMLGVINSPALFWIFAYGMLF